MTHETGIQMAELYAQDMQPARAAVEIAKAHGFDNVIACDDSNIEVPGTALVATFGVTWLDICGNEKPALALWDMEVDRRVDREPYEFVGCGLCDVEDDARRFDEFACLFVF